MSYNAIDGIFAVAKVGVLTGLRLDGMFKVATKRYSHCTKTIFVFFCNLSHWTALWDHCGFSDVFEASEAQYMNSYLWYLLRLITTYSLWIETVQQKLMLHSLGKVFCLYALCCRQWKSIKIYWGVGLLYQRLALMVIAVLFTSQFDVFA